MSNKDAGRRRLAPEDRREELLAAACDLLESVGVAGLSMDAVARACGASRALVYHYFPSKAELVRAVVERESAGIRAAVPSTSIEEGVLAYLQFALGHPTGYRAVHRGALDRDPGVVATLEASRRELEHLVLENLNGDDRWRRALAAGWMALLVELTLELLDDPALGAANVRDSAVRALRALAP